MWGTIVVFGLSGVGKSHLISRLIAARSDILRVQASALLKAAKEREGVAAVDAEHLRRDKVIDNQALLLREFLAVRHAEARALIFEGHNLVDTPAGLQEIPFEIVVPNRQQYLAGPSRRKSLPRFRLFYPLLRRPLERSPEETSRFRGQAWPPILGNPK